MKKFIGSIYAMLFFEFVYNFMTESKRGTYCVLLCCLFFKLLILIWNFSLLVYKGFQSEVKYLNKPFIEHKRKLLEDGESFSIKIILPLKTL